LVDHDFRGKLEPMSIAPSVQYSITIRLEAPAKPTAVSELTSIIEKLGGLVTAVDVNHSDSERVRVDLTCATRNSEHAKEIVESLKQREGVVVGKVSDRTFLAHLGGKLTIESKLPIRNRDDLSLIYTPGVARICEAIAQDPQDARRLTIKRNTIAVVTDGSAVLGLGNIGPLAALPVMEGKAALFKRFANIDAFPICLDTQDTDEIVRSVKAIAPVFAGINLEDISAPRCFEIEERLRAELDIPVFHDDQHGTAIVCLAALTNALKVVGKKIDEVKLVLSGAGAAGTAVLKLLFAAGLKHAILADQKGIIVEGRADIQPGTNLEWLSKNTNQEKLQGTLKQALVGADVFIGVSAGNILEAKDIAVMNDGAIVFALANPIPEIDPAEAAKFASVVATGRSDFPNQINNVLAFPGVFRGLLDAGATEITEGRLLAASKALAKCVDKEELNASYIIPSVFHPDVAQRVADAVRTAKD
jgi:malate dehydrogenase (oxaloacetate-decarboxylating)